uniref:EGF_CA domain-containing protein n=1 Tax=Globodera pallida TaxID=36090 RepID=A0A183BQC5_GLOPA
MESVAILLAFAIIVNLGPSTGLKCKTGAALAAEDSMNLVETSKFAECPEKGGHPGPEVAHYCVAIACKRANLEIAAIETFISCNCTFGEKDKDWNNDELECKKGQFDAKGYGNTSPMVCIKGSTYCFAAKCTKEGRHYDTWGCTSVKNCAVLSKELKAHCNCSFGERMVKRGNENLIIPSFLNTTDSAKNWRTGKDLNEKETQDVPLQISPEGRIVIHAKSIHKIADEGGVVPDVIKLYFNGSTNDESRKMILNICVPNVAGSREKCKDG